MKKIAILVMLFISCIGLNAQEVVSQENVQKAKAINQVKLSEEAMYAEVIQLASDDFEAVSLAQQKTISKLQNNVVEACAHQMKLTKEQAQEIFDTIDDKCQNVVIKKGDMVRVFAYIAKDAVGLSRKKAKQKDIDEVFGMEEETDSIEIQKNIEKAIELTMGGNDSINYVSEQVKQSAKQAAQTAQQVTQQTMGQNASQTVVVVQQPTQSATTTVQAGQTIVVVQQPTTPVTPAVVPTPEPEVEPKTASAVAVTVPDLCQNIIDKGNFDNVRRYLEQEKTYHRLMYGTARTMQRPEKCYIVLTEKTTGSIVAVLDKGESERMNFVTKKMDHFRNYQGGNYRAIFVQEY